MWVNEWDFATKLLFTINNINNNVNVNNVNNVDING